MNNVRVKYVESDNLDSEAVNKALEDINKLEGSKVVSVKTDYLRHIYVTTIVYELG